MTGQARVLTPLLGPEGRKARWVAGLSGAGLCAGAVLLALGWRQVAWFGFMGGNLGFALGRRMAGYGPRFRGLIHDDERFTFIRPWAWVAGARKEVVRRPSELALRGKEGRWELLGLPTETCLHHSDPLVPWLLERGVVEVE